MAEPGKIVVVAAVRMVADDIVCLGAPRESVDGNGFHPAAHDGGIRDHAGRNTRRPAMARYAHTAYDRIHPH